MRFAKEYSQLFRDLMLKTNTVWGVGGIVSLFRGRGSSVSKAALAARWAGAAFALFSIIYLVGIVVVSEIDPVYNLPMTALGVLPAWNTLLLLLWIFMYWNVY